MSADLLKTPLHALHVELGATHGALRRLRHAGQLPRRHHRRAPAVPRVGGAVRRLAHGPGAPGRRRRRRRRWKRWCRSTCSTWRVGQQRYAFFTNASGGILDDLMITRREDDLLLVVNAGCKDADIRAPGHPHRPPLPGACRCPSARCWRCRARRRSSALAHLNPAVAQLVFMTGGSFTLAGADCLRHALGLHRRGRLRDLGAGRRGRGAGARAARPARGQAAPAWARATRCAWKPACACTATTSTPAPARSRPA